MMHLSRRKFIASAIALLGLDIPGLFVPTKKIFLPPASGWLDPNELFISKVLNSPEGREALAKALAEPIRRALDLGCFSRKIIDEVIIR